MRDHEGKRDFSFPANCLFSSNSQASEYSLFILVHLDGAVEFGELLLEQLEVGIEEAQLQCNRLFEFLVVRCSEKFIVELAS